MDDFDLLEIGMMTRAGSGGIPADVSLWNLHVASLGPDTTIITLMKAHVYVTLKTSVLDPQGQTIQNALRKIGYSQVTAVRQGKYFALTLADGLSAEEARAQVEKLAIDVLTNPVIEEYTYTIES
jgi:phosphoribosylformylglycinamidine synthase